MFPKSIEYSLKILIWIYQNYNGVPFSGDDIAKGAFIPKNYNLKLLQKLVKGKFLKSQKGKGGGFLPVDNSFLIEDVIKWIDGELSTQKCILGLDLCKDDTPCPFHGSFKDIKNKFYDDILNKDISSFCNNNTYFK